MTAATTIYEAVRACSIALLAGAVLQVGGVSAGNGTVIDWRTVKSGETIQADGDAFDTAYLFVTLVGAEEAAVAAASDLDIAPPPPAPEVAPRITAFAARHDGARRRSFEVGPFTVVVEPHEDDAAQAAFVEALARAAVGVAS